VNIFKYETAILTSCYSLG